MKPNQSSEYTLLLAPVTAATTVRTAQFDMSGIDYATVIVTASAEATTNSTNVALALAKSDGTNHTTLATHTLDNTAAAQRAFHHVNATGDRYLRVTITPDATTNGPVITGASVVAVPEYAVAAAGTLL
jgi:arginyl-tRNA synthetase